MKTETALEKSIEKWEKIVKGTGTDEGGTNCALCIMFDTLGCEGCPVHEKTGYGDCYGTPFKKWTNHHYKNHLNELSLKVFCKICLKLAKEELAFLKSLKKKVKK